jgi:hypothetical protein
MMDTYDLGGLNKYQKVMLDVALDYIDRGWSVLPVSRKKIPLNANGSRGASSDKQQVLDWWSQHPDAQVGIATGEISGIWVVDIDMKNGKDGVSALQNTFGSTFEIDPQTLIQKTPTGGFHFVFSWDKERPVHNAQDIVSGVDIRGDGGFIMAAPSSFNINGEWIAYRWNDLAYKPVDAPQWAWDLANQGNESRSKSVDLNQAIEGIDQGSRDDDLFRIACMLRSREVTADTSMTFISILADRCKPPFSQSEAVSKVERAYSAYSNINAGAANIIQTIKKQREETHG